MGGGVIISLNHSPESSCTIRQVITSKSNCLALEVQHQIVYLERGAILHRERDRQRTVRDKHLLIIPPGRGAELRVAAMSKLYQVSFGNFFWDHPRFVDLERIQVFRLPEELVSRVRIAFSQMLGEYTEKNPGYKRMIRLKLEELGLLLERALPRLCSPDLDQGASTLAQVVAYIQSHYDGEFSLHSLARLCGLTPSYFSRVFKEKTGTPVFEYINRIRVRKACVLLKRSNMSIIEIAYAVGYNNVSFFNRYFRKLNGMSPREYKKYIRR